MEDRWGGKSVEYRYFDLFRMAAVVFFDEESIFSLCSYPPVPLSNNVLIVFLSPLPLLSINPPSTLGNATMLCNCIRKQPKQTLTHEITQSRTLHNGIPVLNMQHSCLCLKQEIHIWHRHKHNALQDACLLSIIETPQNYNGKTVARTVAKIKNAKMSSTNFKFEKNTAQDGANQVFQLLKKYFPFLTLRDRRDLTVRGRDQRDTRGDIPLWIFHYYKLENI